MFLPASSIGFLSAAVLNLNNMRDFESDKLSNKHTLAGLLGLNNSRYYHLALILIAMLLMLLYFGLSSEYLLMMIMMIGFIPLFIHMFIFYKVQTPENYDPQLKILALSTFLVALIFGTIHVLI